MNLFKKAETDKEIRLKRPKKSKEPNSVEVAHPEKVFVLEGPGNLGQAKNTVEIREEIMKAFNKRPGVFLYQGVTASKLKDEFSKVASLLCSAGLYDEAIDLFKIAEGEDVLDVAAPAATKSPLDNLKELQKARKEKLTKPSSTMEGATDFLSDLQQEKVDAPAATIKPKAAPAPAPSAPLPESEEQKPSAKVEELLNRPSAEERAKLRKEQEKAQKQKSSTTPASADTSPKASTFKAEPEVKSPEAKISLPDDVRQTYTSTAPSKASDLTDEATNTISKSKLRGGVAGAVSKGADALANSSKLQKGLGALGVAGSLWSVFSEGPNASNVTSAILSSAPMLVGGSIVSAPVAAGAAATGLAGILLYKAFTGTVKETLDTDIDQAQEEIRDILSDSDYSERSRKILNKLSANLNKVKQAYNVFQLGKGTDQQNIQAAQVLVAANGTIQKDFEQFALIGKDESGLIESKIRGFFGGPSGFPKLSNAIKDIQEDLEQALAAFAADSESVANIVSQVAVENASSPEEKAKLRQVNDAEKNPAEKERQRIAGIQKYLMENGAADVTVNGELDGPTFDALQEMSNKFSSLGIPEASVEKLSRLTYNDMYILRDRLINARNR